jgi:arylsulfatase A-like enzyme
VSENRARSLILVTVDCLRADHAGFLGYSQPTTPFLDSLAPQSVIVPNAIVAGAPTYYSFPALLASRYPLALGREVLGVAPGEASLATVLAHAGYRTASLSAANSYLCARFGYQQGFELFCDFLDSEVAQPGRPASREGQLAWYSRLNRGIKHASRHLRPFSALYDELYFHYCQWLASRSQEPMDSLRRVPPANVLVEQALTWIRNIAGQPFFLWLHFMDAHHPYFPPEEALAAMGRSDIDAARARYLNSFWDRRDLDASHLHRHRNDVIALYDAAIRWVDKQMSRLVQALVELGLWSETAFVVTADHGEEFLDHGGRYHAPVKLTEELIRVPLLMRLPGMQAEKAAKVPFSLLDLAPTLLDAMGIPAPPEFQGRSRRETLHAGHAAGAPAIVEVVDGCTNPFRPQDRTGPRLLAVRESRYKLVIHFAEEREELFDLENDPGERSPLPSCSAADIRRRLLEIAKAHISQSPAQQGSNARLRARSRDVKQALEWSGATPEKNDLILAQVRTGT